MRNTPEHWGAVAKAFHWVIAALILVQLPLGWIAQALPLSPTKLDVFVWHKSVGVTVLVLVLARIAWRLANPTPALPADLPRWERRAARASHLLLYALMLAQPLSGWIINAAANIPFRVFWLVPLPDPVAPDEALEASAKTVHLSLFVVLVAALAVHVGAALRHHFVRRNAVLMRMLPLGGSPP
ncbi:MAG: cytochrome b [Gammaproteobacteria bacterium]|nr:cytochrome b [Gammaproteobacteria bacterium]